MGTSLWEKIEAVREQPEHIRMRYLLVWLSIFMFFITGIWLLSLKESFGTVASALPAVSANGKELLPTSGQTQSLKDLLLQATPLRVEDNANATGGQFFDTQMKNRQEGMKTPPQTDSSAGSQ